MPSSIVDVLLASDEPSVRWKVRVHALGKAGPRTRAAATRSGRAGTGSSPPSPTSATRPATRTCSPSATSCCESKRLPDGGWPTEARYYEGFGTEARQSFDHVDWGGVDNHRANDSVTADALAVLAAAGRPS